MGTTFKEQRIPYSDQSRVTDLSLDFPAVIGFFEGITPKGKTQGIPEIEDFMADFLTTFMAAFITLLLTTFINFKKRDLRALECRHECRRNPGQEVRQ